MDLYERLDTELAALRERGAYRRLPVTPEGLCNLSSNDYLGLSRDEGLREAFYAQLRGEDRQLSSASSRLLTGNTAAARSLEAELAEAYGAEAALAFDSGYHANTGILPALVGPRSLVLADRLSHASMIDGIRAAGCKFFRYRHNDLGHVRQLLERHAGEYDEVFVMTESVFSMDGDRTDLRALAALKRDFPNVVLYVDEAHGVGCFGETGLGCAQEEGVLRDIDLLVGTCGKALCSMGAYVICRRVVREALVNRMRPFIFTTALPPINLAWTRFVMRALPGMAARRARLRELGRRLAEAIRETGRECVSESQIVPVLIGGNEEAAQAAERGRGAGFHVLPIRPTTGPEGTALLRFSLTADLPEEAFGRLLDLVCHG